MAPPKLTAKALRAALDHKSKPKGAEEGPEIEHVIDDLLSRTSGGFRYFVLSVYAWYEKHGWITAKQYCAIMNAYEGNSRTDLDDSDDANVFRRTIDW